MNPNTALMNILSSLDLECYYYTYSPISDHVVLHYEYSAVGNARMISDRLIIQVRWSGGQTVNVDLREPGSLLKLKNFLSDSTNTIYKVHNV